MVHIGEGAAFIRGREQMCREISPQDVIVSLNHPRNSSSRKTPTFKEPNGCHYGFNEKLFGMVTQIGEELLNSAGRTASDRGGESSGCGGGDHPLQGQPQA